jgi:hypothetical protein
MVSAPLDSLVKLAFYDELEKISARTAEQQRNRDQVKKWFKNSAIIAGGSAAATGLSMLAARYAPKIVGKEWGKLTPKQQVQVLGPVMTAGNILNQILLQKMLKEKVRRMRE